MKHHVQLARRLGPGWAAWRAMYELRKRSGLLRRRFPTPPWSKVRLAELLSGTGNHARGESFGSEQGIEAAYRAYRERNSPPFFLAPGALPEAAILDQVTTAGGRERTLAVADNLARGRFLYYSHVTHDLGWPPDWMRVPGREARHDSGRHWCDYPTFSKELGDIKDVWEPSRFACAYSLVRAYALTRDEKYPAAFWTLFESWREQNPPNRGPNFKCGQETALRCMAWCFALWGFWKSPATTDARVVAMVESLAFQAERIAGNIDFAISQKNNHALSEAVGVLTIGLLFPELKGSDRWEALGRQVLEREVRRQIYDDGSYVQQSMNYHRVMLHDCLWAIRLAEINGRPLSAGLRERVAKAGEFLFQMLDLESGRVPNYGPNDGALVLPLTACDYLDYRPTVQATLHLANGSRTLPPGPWDEMNLWLFGPAADNSQFAIRNPQSSRFDSGGYYTIRGRDAWCMIRCHTYRDRPAHVDLLHLDLWYKGVNVLGDSGTYKYFAPEGPLVEKYFKDLAAHNTVEIDQRGPLDLVSRFVWLPWPKARCLQHGEERFKGEHDGYNRPPWNVLHRRSVRMIDDATWEVRDELVGAGRHEVAVRWHLAAFSCRQSPGSDTVLQELPCGTLRLELESPQPLKVAVHRGAETPEKVLGWMSEYYGERGPRPTIEVFTGTELPVTLITRVVIDRT